MSGNLGYSGDTIQPGGRSAPRLIDDLLRFIPGTGHLGLSPVDAARVASARPLNSIGVLRESPVPYVSTSMDGSKTVITTIFIGRRYHLEMCLDQAYPLAPGQMYDFHVVEKNTSESGGYRGSGTDASNNDDKSESSSDTEVYSYVCAVSGAKLTVTIRPPEFTDSELAEFSAERIQERFERHRELKPTAQLPSQALCFQTLFRIIRDPLASEERKTIGVMNPTLNMRLNPAILRKLEFELDDTETSYVPPDLHDFSNVGVAELRAKYHRMMLEAADLAISAQEGLHPKPFQNSFNSAVPTMQSMLSVAQYPTAMTEARPLLPRQYGYYVALGAVENFSDELVSSRYDMQVGNDPTNSFHYFEALKGVSQLRESEQLQIRVMELMSLGAVTYDDVARAYELFGLDPQQRELDPTAVDAVTVRYTDIVNNEPGRKAEATKALQLVADASQNRAVKQFLEMRTMDIQQALTFLGSSPEDNDEGVRVSFDLKVNEDPDRADSARMALLTIAKDRQSFELLNYYELLTVGTAQDVQMDLESAYALLGAERGMDDQSLMTIFEIRLKDAPGEIMELRNALRTIGNDRRSELIFSYLETGNKSPPEPEQNFDWPVGLNNIGNTCYLNSLLQYYFTITPLRNAVLGFPQSEDKEDPTNVSNKKIGGRLVRSWEVRRAQDFVVCLSELFNELIHTKDKYVSPSKDLAYLALVAPRDEEAEEEAHEQASLAPQSRASPVPEAKGAAAAPGDSIEVDDKDMEMQEVAGVVPPNTNAGEEEAATPPTDDASETDIDDHHSDIEIVEEKVVGNGDVAPPVVIVDAEDADVDANKENENPKRTPSTEASSAKVKRQNSGKLPLVYNEPDNDMKPETNDAVSGLSKQAVTDAATELEPPALPPRSRTPVEERRKRQIDSALFGRQQDVTECIENVLFQIESAVKPTGVDTDGEQRDIIKELFYGKTLQVLENADDGTNRREKTERFSSLLVDVADGPKDIYEALDSYFGEDIMALESGETRRSVTISELPPILQIQIQRVQFDRVLNRPFKSLARLKFDETIFLDRYLSSDDVELTQKRRQVWAWRSELKNLNKDLAHINARKVCRSIFFVHGGCCPPPP